MPRSSERLIYLLHLEVPLAHARHYSGSTTDLERRLAEHESGAGARMMAVVAERGIKWKLARLWKGDRKRERKLKQHGGASRRCPVCRNWSGEWCKLDGVEQTQWSRQWHGRTRPSSYSVLTESDALLTTPADADQTAAFPPQLESNRAAVGTTSASAGWSSGQAMMLSS